MAGSQGMEDVAWKCSWSGERAPWYGFYLPLSNSCLSTHSHRVDIEFGLQSFRTPRTSLEVLDGHGAVASSAPSVDQVGEAAELDHMSVSVQRPELQPTLPMTVDAEISISPALVQGAPIDRNEPPRHPSGDAQCALTDIERRPAGDDHL